MSRLISSPSRIAAIGPPLAASGATWPTIKPRVAPEKRPSVSSATSSPSPSPTIAAVTCSISRIPGPPTGPSLRITTMSPGRIACSLTARKQSSSDSKTRAGPTCFLRSVPASLTTAPSGARLPRRIAKPPSLLSGSESDRTTSWPSAATAAVEVGGDEAATWLEVRQQRGASRDPLEVVHVQLDPRLMGKGDQVQDDVGRTARCTGAGDRVLQRVPGDHLARLQILSEDADHQLADLLGNRSLVVVFGGHHCRATGADPQRLEGAGHGVGRELPAAGPGAGAGHALELVQFLVGHVTGGVRADRLEDVEDRHVTSVPAPGRDRAAVEQDRRYVEP